MNRNQLVKFGAIVIILSLFLSIFVGAVASFAADRAHSQISVIQGPSPDIDGDGIADFAVKTEQYYLHVDPAARIHAVCDFPVVDGPHAVNGPVAMPVVFTNGWGKGRVSSNALGHQANVIDHGTPRELLRRGLLWAAGQGF